VPRHGNDFAMLTKLELQNFRCFNDHKVDLSPKTLLVGKNNAGKSTCIEALRLVSVITERLGSLHIKAPPRWTGLPFAAKGVSPSLDGIEIHRHSLFYNYGPGPAVVSAHFDSGARLDVHVGDELEVHAVVYDREGDVASHRRAITSAAIPRVSILPQIGPLNPKEHFLTDAYVRGNMQTTLASWHFRNQIRLFPEFSGDFQNAVANSWPGLAVRPVDIPPIGQREETPLSLLIRENDFEAEAAWMGHGLQMWLQTMWFLARNSQSRVLILDEPDVYMHADLQRRLIRMLLRNDKQFIIATHSPEMLAEVEPDSVVVLDRKRKVSRAATSSKAVQGVLQRVGSVHNLSLARLASQRRLLLVEGEDIALLKRVQNVIDPDSDRPVDTVPNIDIEGWGGWHSALTLARFFDKNAKGELEVFCFLDRDYFTDAEIEDRKKEAETVGIDLRIWGVKELENYFVVPAAICRLIEKNSGQKIDGEELEGEIWRLADEMRDDAYFAFMENVKRTAADKSNKGVNKIAKAPFEARWKVANGLDVVGGKELLGKIRAWAQQRYSVSFSIPSLIQAMRPFEVPEELKVAIRDVTRSK